MFLHFENSEKIKILKFVIFFLASSAVKSPIPQTVLIKYLKINK